MLNKTVFTKVGTMVRNDILEGRQDPYTEDEVMKMFGGFGKADKTFAPVTSGSPMETGKCVTYVTDFLNGLTNKDVVANSTVFFGYEIASTPVLQVSSMDELISVVANKQDNLSTNIPMQETVAYLVQSITGLVFESEAVSA